MYIHEVGNHWSPKTITLKHDNPEIISKWHDKFNLILQNQKLKRPQKLIVFVNPFGGKGQAWKINESIIQPLFRKCHIESQVLITERPNHAKDVLKTCDLNGIDGVICIGNVQLWLTSWQFCTLDGVLIVTHKIKNRILLTRIFFEKNSVKVCLHLSYIAQNSFYFDEIFNRKFGKF